MSYNRYKLFIGHLAPETRTRDLERFFKDHGFSKSISEVVVKAGYGFVVFDDSRDADDAIYELNGKELLGVRLQVEFAKSSGRSYDRSDRGGGGRYGGGGYGGGYRSSRDDRGGRDDRGRGSGFSRPYNTDYRVYIENLSTRCSWQDVKDYFRQAGEVTFAKCNREKMGEGVVEFASSKDMKNAIRKLNDTELFGKRLKLTCDGGGSRSRSRSRSPRRSRSFSPRRSFSRSPRRSVSRSRSNSPL